MAGVGWPCTFPPGEAGRFGAQEELPRSGCPVEGQAYCPPARPGAPRPPARQSTVASRDLRPHFGTAWDLAFMQP